MKKYLFVLIAFSATACVPNYSDGSRVGVITKFSHKGLAIKSWEGEMNLGGMREESDEKGNSYLVANIFKFSVTDPAIIKRVQDAMLNGKRTELVYRQWLMHPIGIDTSYVITAVK